jgi:hypothetical protein
LVSVVAVVAAAEQVVAVASAAAEAGVEAVVGDHRRFPETYIRSGSVGDKNDSNARKGVTRTPQSF